MVVLINNFKCGRCFH